MSLRDAAVSPPILHCLRPDPGAALLAPAGAAYDVWGDAPGMQRQGRLRCATEGDWLYGCVEVDAATDAHAAAYRAYSDLFQLLQERGSPHVLRLWNYLPNINAAGSDGIERYRAFNAGRQQAFIDARHSAFENSPAACALGTAHGPLRVYFLAGRSPPLALENPRQVSAYRYPDRYGARSPTFSRAALVEGDAHRWLLLISGTASIVGHATLHLGDVRRQTEESLANLAAVRGVAAERAATVFPADALSYTVYIRRPADLAVVRDAFEAAVGPQSRAAQDALYVHADICRADLLVEIEASGWAARPAAG